MSSADKRAGRLRWEDSASARALARYRQALSARPLQHLGAAMIAASVVALALGLPAGRPWGAPVALLLFSVPCLRSRERWTDLCQASVLLRWWTRSRGADR